MYNENPERELKRLDKFMNRYDAQVDFDLRSTTDRVLRAIWELTKIIERMDNANDLLRLQIGKLKKKERHMSTRIAIAENLRVHGQMELLSQDEWEGMWPNYLRQRTKQRIPMRGDPWRRHKPVIPEDEPDRELF